MIDRHAQGMETRRKVLGDAHVGRAEKNKTAFDQPFQELITEAAWGMFGRGIISRRVSAQ